MSWDQGIQVREDLPENFIKWAEDKYFRSYGQHGYVEYITWFGLGDQVEIDFGPDAVGGLTLDMTKFAEK